MDTGNRKGTLWHHLNVRTILYNSMEKNNCERRALQAQETEQKIYFNKIFERIKRVSFRLSVKKRIKAAITVEASIAIPVFLFCFLEIMSLLQALNVYSNVLFAVKKIGESVSVYGYVYDELIGERDKVTVGQDVVTSVLFSEGYLRDRVRKECAEVGCEAWIKGGTQGISLLGSHVNSQKSCISIYANYDFKPFISLTGKTIHMTNRFYAKLWTGYIIQPAAAEGYVYITEYGSVYHLSTECTHLRLSIKSITAEDLKTARNEYDKKYDICEKCCGKTPKKAYYIAVKGDCYHEEINCSGLKRTIKCVPESEVEGWKACQRCAEG